MTTNSNNNQTYPKLDQVLLVCRVVVMALLSGIFMFGMVIGITGPMVQPQDGARQGHMVLVYSGIGLVAVVSILHFIIPKMITRTQLPGIRSDLINSRPLDEIQGRLGKLFQTEIIVGAAVIEFGAMFNLIMYMQHRNVLSLVAVAVCAVFLALSIPTKQRALNWLKAAIEE